MIDSGLAEAAEIVLPLQVSRRLPHAPHIQGMVGEIGIQPLHGLGEFPLTELLKEPIQVIGASRTDSGVHALGNVAVFDTLSRMPAGKVAYALNQRLPEDIRIQNGFPVDVSV